MDLPANYEMKFRPRAEEEILHQPKSDWQAMLDQFYDKLNTNESKAAGFEEYTHARIAGALAKNGVRNADAAYIFFQRCMTGSSFGGLFTHLTGTRRKKV